MKGVEGSEHTETTKGKADANPVTGSPDLKDVNCGNSVE